MSERMSLQDWEHLFNKATTRMQIAVVYSSLVTYFLEEQEVLEDKDWLLLMDIISAATERVGEIRRADYEGIIECS